MVSWSTFRVIKPTVCRTVSEGHGPFVPVDGAVPEWVPSGCGRFWGVFMQTVTFAPGRTGDAPNL